MKLTPWLVAHKVGHAMNSAERNGDSTAQEWVEITNNLHGHFIDDEGLYDTKGFASILTFKSARADKLNTAELDLELIAQYLIQGKITFRIDHLPEDKAKIVSEYETNFNEFLTNWFKELNGCILVAA